MQCFVLRMLKHMNDLNPWLIFVLRYYTMVAKRLYTSLEKIAGMIIRDGHFVLSFLKESKTEMKSKIFYKLTKKSKHSQTLHCNS